MEIKFDSLNEILNNIVSMKKDFDCFKKVLNDFSSKVKDALDDINSLIIIFIIGDGFI